MTAKKGIPQYKSLRALGQQIRDRRKDLRLSSIVVAESAGVSRITLYRIEKGEASVSIGSYDDVVRVLGLELKAIDPQKYNNNHNIKNIPKKIRIANYKQLKKIAWQIKDTQVLSPAEVLDLYERNWRHLDLKRMDSKEKKLLKQLMAVFGRERLLV